MKEEELRLFKAGSDQQVFCGPMYDVDQVNLDFVNDIVSESQNSSRIMLHSTGSILHELDHIWRDTFGKL